jgi:signal transduction histidine kinase
LIPNTCWFGNLIRRFDWYHLKPAIECEAEKGCAGSSGVLVAVQDSGPGLNPESFDRLFDAFYTTKTGGMGMGLSICRSIVEAHGGRIWASLTSGSGATVQFNLPGGES